MKAVRMGGSSPSDGAIREIENPVRGNGDVVVGVRAASINPSDLFHVVPGGEVHELAWTPGRDFAGIVLEGPESLRGAEVWGTGGDLGATREGTHAERIVLPALAVRPKPATLTFEEAATVGVAFTTAWYALVEVGGMRPDDRVLILGAAGAVGAAATQICSWQGVATIYGVVHDESQVAAARAAGASLVTADAAELPSLTEQDDAAGGATLCLDAAGGTLLNAAVATMAHAGRIVEIGAPSSGQVLFDLRAFYRAELHLAGLNTFTRDAIQEALVLDRIRPGFESGALRPTLISARYPLERASDAYRAAAARPEGKVMFVMPG